MVLQALMVMSLARNDSHKPKTRLSASSSARQYLEMQEGDDLSQAMITSTQTNKGTSN
jgi:hypothetical protein